MTHLLFELLARLDAARIPFTPGRDRADAITVLLAVASERVEVDVFADGHMDVSCLLGSETIVGGIELLEHAILEHRD